MVNLALWEAKKAVSVEQDAVRCAWRCMDLDAEGGTCNAILYDRESKVCLMGEGRLVGATTEDTGLRVAWSSSTVFHASSGNYYHAWFAVDRKTQVETSWGTYNDWYHSYGKASWFAMDLTQSHAVTSVTIHPRRTGCCTDRSNNIDIRVGDARPPPAGVKGVEGAGESGSFPENELCASRDGSGALGVITIPCEGGPKVGRYLTIKRKPGTSDKDLNIAEVVVDSVPASSPTTEVYLLQGKPGKSNPPIADQCPANFPWAYNEGKDCCAANTEETEADLATSGPDSKAGSHGLLTYASTSCYGGKKTLTTPCPKGSCLNYKLKRYSCFIADIEPGGDLVDGYGVKESRKVIF